MSWYLWVKWLHIVSSTILFGTGAGIAFFFVRAQRTGDTRIIASVARDVVLADAVFTATAVIIQPSSGVAGIHRRSRDILFNGGEAELLREDGHRIRSKVRSRRDAARRDGAGTQRGGLQGGCLWCSAVPALDRKAFASKD